MGKLHQKVIRCLAQRFADVTDALDDVEETGRITGVVISKSFDRLDHAKRQNLLWEALGKGLTPAEQSRVGPIATLTPAEANLKVG